MQDKCWRLQIATIGDDGWHQLLEIASTSGSIIYEQRHKWLYDMWFARGVWCMWAYVVPWILMACSLHGFKWDADVTTYVAHMLTWHWWYGTLTYGWQVWHVAEWQIEVANCVAWVIAQSTIWTPRRSLFALLTLLLLWEGETNEREIFDKATHMCSL
jgi:hypothetical protein